MGAENVMKILLVCTGNTCRSSMAQVLLEKLVEDKEGLNNLEIKSAGTYAMEGDKASNQAIGALRELGLSLEKHSATPLSHDLILWADLVLTMTVNHKICVLNMNPGAAGKVFTLREFVEVNGKEKEVLYSLDIRDPFGQSLGVYRECAQEINQYLNHLLEILQKNK